MKRNLATLYSGNYPSTRSRSSIISKELCNDLPHPQKRQKKQPTQFIRATSLKNYMIKDSLVDWLNTMKYPKEPVPGFSSFIMNRGNEFEKNLVKYINDNKYPVVKVSDIHTDESVKKTIELMKQGIPIIHSAPVKNTLNNTGGVIDLLIRSDYLEKITNECPLTDDEKKIGSPKLGFPFHYVVVDIKFSTLPLTSDGKHILNSGMFPAYKAQTLIYNDAVSQIQGYNSRYSYILGRRWKYKSRYGDFSSLECMDKLGIIDYNGFDKKYVNNTKSAVKWIRDMHKNGAKWSISPPTKSEMRPNMRIVGEMSKQKQKIADNIGDITSLWFCGPKNREIALKNGIKSWRDKKCNSKMVGIKGVRAKILDKIIKINQQNKVKILPKIIKSTFFDWRTKKPNEVYIDFETISDIFAPFSELPKQSKTEMLFMIGVGWEDDGKWVYKNFTCKDATLEEEYRIMDEFSLFIKEKGNPDKYFWSAEKRFWDSAEKRQFDREDLDEEAKNNISDNWKINGCWNDICELFRQEPIVIKDCFNFGLKNISSAMYNHKLISTKIESNCNTGMMASVNAWKAYKNIKDPINSSVFKDIINYNQFDCKVLWNIIGYFRNNH